MPSQQCQCLFNTIQEAQAQLGPQGNEYLFLRSIWKSQPVNYTHALADSHDQLDRINKIVAMMKKHVNYNVCKQISYINSGWETSMETGTREEKILQQMNKALMEKQQLGGKLEHVMRDNIILKEENQRLKMELEELKNKTKQDSKSIKKLSEKNASLSNKLLASDFNCQKSQCSYMKSPRNHDDVPENSIGNALLNLNINIATSESGSVTNLSKQRSERCLLNKKNISIENMDDQSQSLNQSVIETQFDESATSISNYSFLGENMNEKITLTDNKETSEQSEVLFHYQSQRNLLKQRNILKNRLKCTKKTIELGDSPKIKFIRQNSKHSLLRKAYKTQTTIPITV